MAKDQPKGFIRSANAERTAAKGIEVIMAKLKAGEYKNQPYEDADRRMLEFYLNGGDLYKSHRHDR